MVFLFAVNKIIHILTAIIGVGAATLGEVLYLKDMRDGKIDANEARQLKITYHLMRWSMIILIISGILMVGIIVYKSGTAILYDSRMMAKYIIVIIMVANAAMIKFRKIPMWLGAPLSLVSWWAEFVLGKWRLLEEDLYVIIFVYIIAVLIVGVFLKFIEKLISKPAMQQIS